MKINIKQFEKWMLELRSGKYSQTKDVLQDSNGYCCLGVACKILIPASKISLNSLEFLNGKLPINQLYAPEWLKGLNKDFEKKTGVMIETLNDFGISEYQYRSLGVKDYEYHAERFTFDELADLLELVYIHKAIK